MSVVYFTGDLVFSARAASAGRLAGLNVALVTTVEQLRESLQEASPALLLLDLTTPGLDLAAVLAALDQTPSRPRVVAYAPHVMSARLQAARDAGCDQVLTRGQFHGQVEAIMQSLGEPPA